MLTTMVRGRVAKDNEETESRFRALHTFLDTLPDHVQVVALPAGFLRAQSKHALQQIANRLMMLARSKNVTLLVGVDLEPKKTEDRSEIPPIAKGQSYPDTEAHSEKFKTRQAETTIKLRDRSPKKDPQSTKTRPKKSRSSEKPEGNKVKPRNYRFYAVACVTGEEAPRIFHQTTVFGSESGLGQFPEENRFFTVGTLKIAVLVCGEIFNSDIRNFVIGQKPGLVVDLAHDAGGVNGGKGAFRGFVGMKIFANAGISSVLAAHTGSAPYFQSWAPAASAPENRSTKKVDFQHENIYGHHWPPHTFAT